ncbi:hypothetical protein [Pantoea sp. 18069]|uniref:hypothetical protein n=1 Tax=Pantoea sp. 18069 TaxID=2681415 RepID=UPI00135AE54F|nr:hypothetical protein [Pantoea sp. 18069]
MVSEKSGGVFSYAGQALPILQVQLQIFSDQALIFPVFFASNPETVCARCYGFIFLIGRTRGS